MAAAGGSGFFPLESLGFFDGGGGDGSSTSSCSEPLWEYSYISSSVKYSLFSLLLFWSMFALDRFLDFSSIGMPL